MVYHHDDDLVYCLRIEAWAERGEKTKTGDVWLNLDIIRFIFVSWEGEGGYLYIITTCFIQGVFLH